MQVGVLVGLVSALAACSFKQPLIACDSTTACPSGMTCDLTRKVSVCVSELPADGATLDAAPIDDAPSDASTDALVDGANDIMDAPPDAPPDAALMCPPAYSYALAGNARYRVGQGTATWLQAVTDCADDRGNGNFRPTHLIVLSSATEDAAHRAAFNGNKWIGFSDRSGAFKPVTDEPTMYPGSTSPPWAIAQPSGGDAEDCVASLVGNGDLDDTDCTNAYAYVCECDDHANDPTNY